MGFYWELKIMYNCFNVRYVTYLSSIRPDGTIQNIFKYKNKMPTNKQNKNKTPKQTKNHKKPRFHSE